MSVLTHHTTHIEAREIAAELRAAGYRATVERCYDYIANIAAKFGGMDRQAAGEVAEIAGSCCTYSAVRNG